MAFLIDSEKIRQNYSSIIGKGTVVLKFKASADIGLGHLFRMITLASYLGGREVICAINNDKYITERLEKENLRFIVNDFETEKEFVDFVIKKYKPNTIIIDEKCEYKGFDILRWKESTKLIAIDFVGEDYHLFDKIIMPNAHFEPDRYINFHNIVWGWDWVLINKEILKLKPKNKLTETINDIVVTTGGSDPEGVLFSIIDWLNACNRKFSIKVLLGNVFKHKKRLDRMKLPENFRIIPYDSAELLSGDAAIATFGVSIYELIYLNIPTICIAHTKENAEGGKILQKRFGVIKNMGYFKDIKTEKFCETIISLTNKKQKYADIFGRDKCFEIRKATEHAVKEIENV